MSQISQEAELWLREYHPAPDRKLTLVCFPHAGGAASYYFRVSKALAPAIGTLAVQYPGRQDRRREPPVDDVRVLATSVARVLTPWLDGNLAFFGHSMGAIVAFEVALRLEREHGKTLEALFVSGRRAPFRHRDEYVHRKDDAGIIAEVRKLSGTNEEFLLDEELQAMILPALRADYRAIETYRYQPGPRLATPILALIGDQDPRASLDEADGWREHTSGPFDLRIFPGGHFYLNDQAAEVLSVVAGFLLPRSAQRD
jgi:surfactin synthase thioesterase subunit